MKIDNIFCSYIATDELFFTNHKELVNYCKEKILVDSEYIAKGTNQTFFLDKQDPIFSNLLNDVTLKINSLNEFLGLKEDLFQHICEAWLNLGSNKNINVAHNHPNRFMSGVLYINVDQHTELKFMTPITNHNFIFNKTKIHNYNNINSAEWTITPNTGMLIVFPSWLYHFVNISHNDHNRISLAFNTWIE
jgi:uncharacterized protein (TIGR02466 family)